MSQEIQTESPLLDLRKDFPLLRDSETVYLDSAASAQKPECVIRVLDSFYRQHYANIHRGVYPLSVEATLRYESAREDVAAFIGARSSDEIVFTHGATEGINLVASSWGRNELKPGDEILLSVLEHHANIVPWQIVAEQTGARIKYVGLDDGASFDMEDFASKLSDRTKLVAVTQLANGLGIAPPLQDIIDRAHQVGAVVLIDGAQAAAHEKVNVESLGADFYVFSGHKLYGPTGVGVLYGRFDLLDAMPPFLSGGDMIQSVGFEGTEYKAAPSKFEAGTPDIAGVLGLSESIRYLENIGLDRIRNHEQELVRLLGERLAELETVRVLGRKGNHVALMCMVVEDIHPHDLAQYLSDKRHIAVRAGHHCAQLLLTHLGVPATTRVSFGVYNTAADVETVCSGLEEAISFFCR